MPKASKAAASNEDLPPGWEAREHLGKIVYINHATRTTQWNRPKVKKTKGKPPGSPWSSNSSTPPPPPPAKLRADKDSEPRKPGGVSPPVKNATGRNTSKLEPASALGPLPTGWESKVMNGNVVYIDHINRVTTYDRPVALPASNSAPAVGADMPSSANRRVDAPAVERPLSGSSSGSRPPKMKNAGDSIDSSSGRVRQSHRSATGPGVGAVRRGPNGVDSPLPQGWTRSVTAEGEVYYVNHVHRTTTWMKPSWNDEEEDEGQPLYTGNPAEPESSARSNKGRKGYFNEPSEPPLPSGWEERMFEEGRVFYINHNDETTHWERPDPPADYRPNITVSKETSPGVAAADASRPAPNYVPMATEVEEEEEESFAGRDDRSESNRRAKVASYEPVVETRSRELEQPADAGVASEPPLGNYEDTMAKAEAGVSVALVSGRSSDRAPSTTVADSKDIQAEPSVAVTPAVSEPARDVEPRPTEISPVASIPKRAEPSSVPTSEESPSHVSGGAGSVSAIFQSGLFGPTIKRPVSTLDENGGSPGSSSLKGDASNPQPGNTDRRASPPADASDEKSVATSVWKGAEDELPEGWIILKTPEGKVYYQNTFLKCTQWDRPKREVSPDSDKADAPTQTKTATYSSSMSGGGTAAEVGWEKVMTADGKPYFQNVITRKTSWNPPVGWKESTSPVATTAVGTHPLYEDKGDGHAVALKSAETAKEVVETSDERGDRTGDSFAKGPEATASPVENSRQDLSAGPEDPQDPPLPPGWEKLYTDDGVPFWTNHNARTTSWDPPPGISLSSEAIDASQASSKDTRYPETEDSSVEASSRPVSGSNFSRCFDANGRKLPEGWEMLTTDQGAVYYVDHINKRTSWDPPQLSSGGQSVLDTGRPDIPPAELVPDSADLYMGADLLNRFFSSWPGDAHGKSPLEAARNVIVNYLAGPGLKVMKSRDGSSVSRFLFLGPDNKQIVWATKASSKGKYSKKGMTLETITELQSEDGAIKIEMRGEEMLTLKSEPLETITSEGASILLGVLLADMTGSVLRLAGVNGDKPCSYYPASFVDKVLKVRQARQNKKDATASAALASQDVLQQPPEEAVGARAEARATPSSASNGGPSPEVPSESSNLKELTRADNPQAEVNVVYPVENPKAEKRDYIDNQAVGKGGEPDAQTADGGGDTEEDQEKEEYRRMLEELLRPVKLERYVDDFIASEITLDILPLVERSDLERVVGIESAVSQLKIIRQIKKRFPNGVL